MIMIVVVRITVMMLRLTISDGNEHKSVNNDADDNSENDDLDKGVMLPFLFLPVFREMSNYPSFT